MTSSRSRWHGALAAALLVALAGCGGGQCPVRGKVIFDDGSPVTGGLVVFESKDAQPAVTARGAIQADGSYALGTHKADDGVPPGVYRVLLSPPAPAELTRRKPKPPFDERYLDFRTSGLECEVHAGTNEFPIRVARNRR
jgi:hypothetical protein